ncbi:MAG: gamma-glutamylcyclotransferase, partial [Deltaproteobacteria bacterium]|nr:gamma-glutamylcyclotransferase [Deltaproteobacteria bacterium]
EVYEVDLPTLALLDELEDHPHRYIREQVSVILKNGQEMSAWVYFYPRKIGVLEPCGDYAERTANEFGRSE